MVTVNNWYHMQIKIHHNLISLSLAGALFNSTNTVYNTSQITTVYLGGIPYELHKTSLQPVVNFTGCIYRMTAIADVNKVSFYCQSCPARTASFNGSDSMMIIYNENNVNSNSLHVSFQFKTHQPYAFIADLVFKTMHAHLILHNGSLRAHLFPKSESTETSITEIGETEVGEILLDSWNIIDMRFSTLSTELILTLNGDVNKIKGARGLLAKNSKFCLGGKGFFGCIKNMIVHDAVVEFSSKLPWIQMSRVVVGDCSLASTSLTNFLGNTTHVLGNTTDLLGNGSVIEGTNKSPVRSDISLFYQITATIVIVLFVFIVFYAGFILIKNRFQVRRHKDGSDTNGRRMNSRGQYHRRASDSDDALSLDNSNNFQAKEQEYVSPSEPTVAEKRNSQFLSVECPKEKHKSTQSLQSLTRTTNVRRGSLILSTPQPQIKAQRFSITDISCLILDLQGDEMTFQNRDHGEQRPVSFQNVEHKENESQVQDKNSRRTNPTKKPTNIVNSPAIFNPCLSSTYNWAYIRPDSETECSESEKVRSTKLDASYRPFSLRILEGNESEEDENEFGTGHYNNNLQTFRSRSTDNVAKRDFLKVCFDPYMSSSQDEKLVCFGAQSASSDPSVRSSSLDPDVCKTLQQKYSQQRNGIKQPRSERYRKLQVDSAPSEMQDIKLESNGWKDKEQQEQEKESNPLPQMKGLSNEIMTRNSNRPKHIKGHRLADALKNYCTCQMDDGKRFRKENNELCLLERNQFRNTKLSEERQHEQEDEQLNRHLEKNLIVEDNENKNQTKQQDIQQDIKQQQNYQKKQQQQSQEGNLPQHQLLTKTKNKQRKEEFQQQFKQVNQHLRQQQPPQEHKEHQHRSQGKSFLEHLRTQIALKQRNQMQRQQQQEGQQNKYYGQQQDEEQQKPSSTSASVIHGDNEGDKSSLESVNNFNSPTQNCKLLSSPSIIALGNDLPGNLNPWVLRQGPVNNNQDTTTVRRLYKPLPKKPFRAKSSSFISRPSADAEAETDKDWKRSSWDSGNPSRDRSREQSRDIELVLKGTVPVKKPPSNAAILLAVPGTKGRPKSETMH